MSLASEILADSPYGYWPLDDASGTTAVDASGNGRDGTYTGGVTLAQPGLVGDAVALDGSTGYVDFGDVFDIGAGVDYSMVVMLSPEKATSLALLTKDADFTGLALTLDPSNGEPPAWCGRWGMLHIVNDRNVGTTYWYNGVQFASAPGDTSADNYSNAASLWFGSWLGILWYQGAAQHLAVYTSALDATRVEAHATAAGVFDDTWPTIIDTDAPAQDTSGTVVLTRGTDRDPDDIEYVGIYVSGTVTAAPAGWTLVDSATITARNAYIYQHVCDGSEVATDTITWTLSGSVLHQQILVALRGSDGISASSEATGSTGTLTLDELTGLADHTLLAFTFRDDAGFDDYAFTMQPVEGTQYAVLALCRESGVVGDSGDKVFVNYGTAKYAWGKLLAIAPTAGGGGGGVTAIGDPADVVIVTDDAAAANGGYTVALGEARIRLRASARARVDGPVTVPAGIDAANFKLIRRYSETYVGPTIDTSTGRPI